MKKASKDDKSRVIKILSESFKDNGSVNFVLKQDSKLEKRRDLLMAYSFFNGMKFGDVFVSDDEKACAIVLRPELKATTFSSLIWELRLLFGGIGIGNLSKVLKREKMLKAYHPTTPYIHLWYIGVMPDSQGEGKGSALLSEVINHYNLADRCIYLETSTVTNIPFYEKHGFRIVDQLDLGYKLYFMTNSKD